MRCHLPWAVKPFPGVMDAWEVLIYGKDLAGIFQELLGFCCCVYWQRKIQFCVLQPPASLWQDLTGGFYELIEFPVFRCLFNLPSSFLGFFWESQASLSLWDGAVGRGQVAPESSENS